ncbi:MAG TPA: lipase family protein [Marmoricola sp.]|nr:lipase family protein [Marmoricola sp.]
MHRRPLPTIVLPTIVLVVLALLGGLLASGTASAATTTLPRPHDDPFYRYTGSTPLGDIRPGTVLKHRSVTLSLFGQGSTPVPAEQLLYRTRDEQRHPSVTVTTVVRPTGPVVGQPRGIVAYLSFYDALGDECDPSYTLRGGDSGTQANRQQAQVEEGLVTSLAGQGYAVTVPDFEGEHLHWVAGQESGWSTLDAVRATESWLGAGRASTPVGLFGYSGGSIAGEWAAELAPHYSPGLDIAGTAIGGIPVHLAHNLRYVNGSPDWSGVIPAVLVSLGRAFGVHVRRYESRYGRRLARQVRHQCIGSFNGAYPGLRVQRLLKHRYRHFLRVPVFARIINHLIMGSTPGHPNAPMLLAVGDKDGTGDGVMVAGDVEALGHEYCRQGVSVRFQRFQGSDHTQAGLQFFPLAEDWLAQRLAGVPATGNCASIGKGNSLAPLKVRHR